MRPLALTRSIVPVKRTEWTRASGNPIISPTQAYDHEVCQEPTVIYESGTWKMWYTGAKFSSTVTGCINYATCTSDPTVAANWTKYAGNPVIGSASSGFCEGTSVHKFGSTYYCYYFDANGGGNVQVVTSSDGITWGAPTQILTAGTPSWCHFYAADLFVWGSAGAWQMLVSISGNSSGGEPWQTAYATSSATTPDSGWSVQGTGPLTTLRPTGVNTNGSVYGDPCLAYDGQKIHGQYHAWFHAGNGNFSDIYHAYSTDAQNWTITTNPDREIRANLGQYEPEQAADPCVIEVNGTSYMFYAGVDNETGALVGYINVATYPGSLTGLVTWKTP